MKKNIRIEDSWIDLVSTIKGSSRIQTVYVLGDTASGKTTLCRYLYQELKKTFKTSYLDCDSGQASIGPPCTIGLGISFAKQPLYYFVGATTPPRALLPTVTGMSKLHKTALEDGSRKIIVDASGYIRGGGGQDFHSSLIELLSPDLIVGLLPPDIESKSSNTLPWIAAHPVLQLKESFSRIDKIDVKTISVSEAAEAKSFEQRKRYRFKQYAKFLKHAEKYELERGKLHFQGSLPNFYNRPEWGNCIISFIGPDGFLNAFGILENIDLKKDRLSVFISKLGEGKLERLRFGSVRINRKGEELHHL